MAAPRVVLPRGLVVAAVYVVAAAVLLAATTRLTGSTNELLVLFGGAVAVWFFVMGTSRRLPLAFVLTVLYLGLLDGYLKLSTGSSFATAARDVLIAAITAGALVRLSLDHRRVTLPPYTWHVGFVVAIVLIAALHPDTPGVRGLAAGVKQHLEFVPLFFLAYALVRTRRALESVALLLVGIAVANAIVAMVQYNLSPTELADWGPGYEERIRGTGDFTGSGRFFETNLGEERTRPFGLGGEAGTSGVLGWLAGPAALALLVAARSRTARLLALIGVAGCALGVVTSQARSSLLLALLAVLVFAALTATTRQGIRSVVALVLGGLVVFLALSTFAGSAEQGSFDRFTGLTPGTTVQTIGDERGDSLRAIPDNAVNYPLGGGLGRVGPGAGFAADSLRIDVETEFSLLISEVGLIGLAIVLSLWLRITLRAVRIARLARDPGSKLILSALATGLLVMLADWFAASPTVSATTAAPFWLFAGIVAVAVRFGPEIFAADQQSSSSTSATNAATRAA